MPAPVSNHGATVKPQLFDPLVRGFSDDQKKKKYILFVNLAFVKHINFQMRLFRL